MSLKYRIFYGTNNDEHVELEYRDIKDYIAKDGEMEERIEKRTAPIKDAFGLWKKGELTLLK